MCTRTQGRCCRNCVFWLEASVRGSGRVMGGLYGRSGEKRDQKLESSLVLCSHAAAPRDPVGGQKGASAVASIPSCAPAAWRGPSRRTGRANPSGSQKEVQRVLPPSARRSLGDRRPRPYEALRSPARRSLCPPKAQRTRFRGAQDPAAPYRGSPAGAPPRRQASETRRHPRLPREAPPALARRRP